MLASKSGTLFRCACFCVLLTTSATKAGMAAPASDTPTAITAHMGGTLRLVAASSGGTLDPQINYSAKYINLFANVYDGLTTFRKADGLAGADVVPDLAEDLPQPEDGGLTYTFRLREGITFSNGQPVATADVVASFRRIFRVGSPTAGAFYGAIKGADACLRSPADCKLEGVVENPATRSITFHLTTPDTEFLHKLAFTHAVILPANAPDHDTGNVPLPSTGPYQLTAYDPNRFLKLERNPYFKEWNAQAQPFGYPDRIDYTFGIPDEAAVTAVENGQYDWMADPIPLDRLGELGSRFASQTHVLRHPAMYFLPMNMREAPFSSLKARQAVNYALNRKAMTILYGGPAIARPLCGMLPSTLPASSTQCFYTKDASPESPAPMWRGTDMEKARNLVRESGTYGQKVTVIAANTSVDLAMGAWVRDMLQNLGYRANLRPLSSALVFSYMQNSDNHVQIGVASWSADYPSASNFLDALLGCENIHPGSDSSINIPGFCNQDVQSLMDKAKTDVSLSAQAQNALWQEADRRVMEQAPVAPAIEKDAVILTSPRLKNLLFTTVNQLLFSQAWVQ